ncbi:MAG: amidohydrolase [Gammaproteobacteria bacterium]|nr:amidohydrolase [Gammaproteobacteria bacterium]
MSTSILLALIAFGLNGCGERAGHPAREEAEPPLYASTYAPLPREATVIEHATILTGAGERIDDGVLVMRDGRIEAVGTALEVAGELMRIDAGGKWLTPGIIDNHSHLGVYPSPAVAAVSDGNEVSDPNTAQVWAEHAVWPQDPGFAAALAGGVTTLQILPGSANLFGGRSVVVKNVPARTVQEMKFPGAPHGLKMACGENPKRVYGVDRLVAPSTRMGSVAGYRQAWARAQDYIAKQEAFASGAAEETPERDLQLETLAGVLRGEILVHNHCYRADEMAVMLDVAQEFGYEIASFHHAVEAYKVADLLAASGTCAAMWADWWGFKLEAFDAVRENIAMVDAAGACAIVHSDSETGIQRLNQEAAKVMAAAQRAGIEVDRADAMRWLSLNPAKSLGIAGQTGSLEVGKMADVVIWDGDPFSVYAKAEKVYIDGALIYDRTDPARQPVSDFELGLVSLDGESR